MRRLINRIFTATGIALVGTLGLMSCSEEIKMDGILSNNSEAVVTFMIPDEETLQFETRAAGDRVDATNEENTFSNIYLVYSANVKDADGKDITIFQKEDLTGKETSNKDGYRNYSLTFAPGFYRFFIVVNLDKYLGDNNNVLNSNSISSIDDVLEWINNFTTSQSITPPNIPMGCLDTEMIRNGYKVSSGIVEISASNTNVITAPLTFLCSKVRYTILFNANENGISKDFGEKRIRFDVSNDAKPYATNYDNQMKIYPEKQVELKNPDFDGNSGDGWFHSEGGGFHFIEYGIAEQYDKNFNSYQDLEYQGSGEYRLEVQGFYRYGGYGNNNSYNKHLRNDEVINSYLYIASIENGIVKSKEETPLMCLYDEQPQFYTVGWFGYVTYQYDNGYANSRSTTATSFSKDLYKRNSVTYRLNSPGNIRIGIKNESHVSNDWTIFDNFRLYYQKIETVTSEGSDTPMTIDLGRFNWPKNGDKYPEKATDVLDPNSDSDDEWYVLAEKAWQGVAYLPENLSNNKTILHFPYCFGNQTTKKGEKMLTLFEKDDFSDPQFDNKDYRSGLERGKFYDIRIQVVNSNVEEDEFTLNVCVIDWNYKPEESIW